jgi:uncharacterized protein
MKDYFIMACECHMYPDVSHIIYYPGVKRWFDGVTVAGNTKLTNVNPADIPSAPMAEELIADMNKYGIDICTCLRESMMDTTGFASCMSTNGQILAEVEKYPDRLMFEANVGPILRRGVKHAIWELEYFVKEKNLKLCKIYQPEDRGPLNDPEMWPFYEKAQELGVVLSIHLGTNFCHTQYGKYCQPIQLEDVLTDFPDLKVIAYHMGFPYQEQLFILAARYPNLYMSVSLLAGWWAYAPYRGYHMLGEAMQFCGNSKQIVLGFDWPFINTKAVLDYFKNLDMPDELVEKYGYKKFDEEDKKGILGENLANLLGVEIRKRV